MTTRLSLRMRFTNRHLSLMVGRVAAMALLCLMVIGVQGAKADTLLLVDDNMAQCPGALPTIQAAVNMAALLPGRQKIRVCAGTYGENVLIGVGNGVDIFGDGPGVTVVTGMPATPGPVFDATGAGRVTIENLTVNANSMLAGGTVRGIRFTNTDGRVQDTQVLNIRDASGGSQGLAISVISSAGQSEVHVWENDLDNFTRVGVLVSGEGASVHVKGNRIEGPDAPRVWAPNGIQISRGSHGVVLDNDVTNIPSPAPPNGAGSGIILFCSGKATVQGNRVSNADIGITIADTEGASIIGNEVQDANFDGISLQFLGFVFGPLGCPNDPAPSPVRKNLINNNVLLDSGEVGISLANFDDVTLPNQPEDNLISNNQIEHSGNEGIHVFNTVANPSDNSFVKNVIRDSVGFDADDDTQGDGTAGTANNWHANRCIKDDPDGLCQKPPMP